jgi:hypothetical protein
MYIPKGEECRFDRLTCERIVVDGSLHVDGKLKTKHISGKGFLYAKHITASSVTADTIDADTISVDSLIAARVEAFSIRAVQNVTVSSLIKAYCVKTNSITYAEGEIIDLHADEVIKLPPLRRSLLSTLFAGFVRSKWCALTRGTQKAEGAAVVSKPAAKVYVKTVNKAA